MKHLDCGLKELSRPRRALQQSLQLLFELNHLRDTIFGSPLGRERGLFDAAIRAQIDNRINTRLSCTAS